MKNKFIKSTLILLIGGLLTKVLSMIIKIIMTRELGIEVLSLYMLILPTFSLFITLGQIGLPIALSRLVALNNRNNKYLYLSIIPVTLSINIIFSIIIILIAPFISNNLLHNPNIYFGIVGIAFVIPFTSLSGICRSYFFGKERMFPHVLSNILENIVRLIFMLIILPKIIYFKSKYIIMILILSNIFSELLSTIILLLFMPKNVSISFNDFKPNYSYIKDAFRLGLPNVSSNLIGNISFFLEPIILTNILLILGYSNNYIIREYGIITGYIIPLLLLPSFFTVAISQAIMPNITKKYNKKDYKSIYNLIFIVGLIIIIFGFIITILFELYGNYFLKMIYKTNLGFNYLKILSPFFIFQYVQSLFIFSLNGMGKVKDIFYLALISSLIRIFSILIFSLLRVGIYSYIISIIINIIISDLYLFYKFNSYIK